MAQESQTVFKCDHPGCDACETEPEFNSSLPGGWVSVDIAQGEGPHWKSVISKTFCGKDHAIPAIIAATQKLEDSP